jgi:hypothetical protein
MLDLHSYSISEHEHRLAAWAAATAARASKNCRFSVEKGRGLLEEAGLNAAFEITSLPAPTNFEKQHWTWRQRIEEVGRAQVHNDFTHGVAAKLINVYLKTRFINASSLHHPITNVLHPPIDAELLRALADKNVGNLQREWKKYKKIGWSNFSSADYTNCINHVREVCRDQPLWKIEYYWKGHQ